MRSASVHRLAMASPDDVSAIEALIVSGALPARDIVGIFGKTEGNGCVNDFTRGYATQSLGLMLRRHLPEAEAAAVCLVMSGGTEGGMSPHWTVFARFESPAGGTAPALAVGRAHTADLPCWHLGRLGQVAMVAQGVRAAMRDAAIGDPADVHFVQVKCPLLTAARVGAARAGGHTTATSDTLKSMGLSRAASALGVAVALGEVAETTLTDGAIGAAWDLWSGRASASAGVELLGHEIIVIGMSAAWTGPLVVDHAVMADAIDVAPVRAALARAGLPGEGPLAPAARSRLVALLGKAEASPDGQIRGSRHTMLDDSDISSTRHARAFVAGALAGLVGRTDIYVSGGAEHQGPPGGGPVAVVVSRAT